MATCRRFRTIRNPWSIEAPAYRPEGPMWPVAADHVRIWNPYRTADQYRCHEEDADSPDPHCAARTARPVRGRHPQRSAAPRRRGDRRAAPELGLLPGAVRRRRARPGAADSQPVHPQSILMARRRAVTAPGTQARPPAPSGGTEHPLRRPIGHCSAGSGPLTSGVRRDPGERVTVRRALPA